MTSIITDGGPELNKVMTEEQAVTYYESATGDKLVALYKAPAQFEGLQAQVAPSSTYDYINTTQTRIYTKFFTGTFRAANTDHRDVQITHGLTLSKIVGVTAKAQFDCALSAYTAAGCFETVAAADAGTSNRYFSLSYDATKIYLSNFFLSTFMTVPKTYSVRVDYTA